jgi:hypothetical protein
MKSLLRQKSIAKNPIDGPRAGCQPVRKFLIALQFRSVEQVGRVAQAI